MALFSQHIYFLYVIKSRKTNSIPNRKAGRSKYEADVHVPYIRNHKSRASRKERCFAPLPGRNRLEKAKSNRVTPQEATGLLLFFYSKKGEFGMFSKDCFTLRGPGGDQFPFRMRGASKHPVPCLFRIKKTI